MAMDPHHCVRCKKQISGPSKSNWIMAAVIGVLVTFFLFIIDAFGDPEFGLYFCFGWPLTYFYFLLKVLEWDSEPLCVTCRIEMMPVQTGIPKEK